MRGITWRLGALSLVMAVGTWAQATTITFNFAGSGGSAPSWSESETSGLTTYTATATGKTYSLQAIAGVNFTATPTYLTGSTSGVSVFQFANGVGITSGNESTAKDEDTGRHINSYGIGYGNYAEILWVAIAPPSGYTIDSAEIFDIASNEGATFIDQSGGNLTYTSAPVDGTTENDTLNSFIGNVFGIYASKQGNGIKLGQVNITLSPLAGPSVPTPASVWAGGLLIAGLAAKKWRSAAIKSV